MRVTQPIDTVLARVGSGFFQQAFVVSDLGAALDALRAGVGCSEFVTLPAMALPYRYRGRDVECSLALAFARSGNVQIEVIQPEAGEGVHVEFLEAYGPGAHHHGYFVDDLAAEVAFARDAGFAEAMSGTFGNLSFAYLDTWDALGLYVELVHDPDGMMQQLMPWRD